MRGPMSECAFSFFFKRIRFLFLSMKREKKRIHLLGPRTGLFDGTPHGLSLLKKFPLNVMSSSVTFSCFGISDCLHHTAVTWTMSWNEWSTDRLSNISLQVPSLGLMLTTIRRIEGQLATCLDSDAHVDFEWGTCPTVSPLSGPYPRDSRFS